MGLGDLLDCILKEENKRILRSISIIMIFIPFSFCVGIGSKGR